MYVALKIPEIWQYDGQVLTLLELVDGQYTEIENSLAFPKVESKSIEQFLQASMTKDYLELIGEFRQWLQGL